MSLEIASLYAGTQLNSLVVAKIKNLTKYFEFDERFCIKKNDIVWSAFKNDEFIKKFLTAGLEEPTLNLHLDPFLKFLVDNDSTLAFYACLKVKSSARPAGANFFLKIYDEEFMLINWFDNCKSSQKPPDNARLPYWDAFAANIQYKDTYIFFADVIFPYMQLLFNKNNVWDLERKPLPQTTFPDSLKQSVFFKFLPNTAPTETFLVKIKPSDGTILVPETPKIYFVKANSKISNTAIAPARQGFYKSIDSREIRAGNFNLTNGATWNHKPAAQPSKVITDDYRFGAGDLKMATFKFKLNSVSKLQSGQLSSAELAPDADGPSFTCLTYGKDTKKSDLFDLYFCLLILNISPLDTDLNPKLKFNIMTSYTLKKKNGALGTSRSLRTEQCLLNKKNIDLSNHDVNSLAIKPQHEHYRLEKIKRVLHNHGRINIADIHTPSKITITYELKYIYEFDIEICAEAMDLQSAASDRANFVVYNILFKINKASNVWKQKRVTAVGVDVTLLNTDLMNLQTPDFAEDLSATIKHIIGIHRRQDVFELAGDANKSKEVRTLLVDSDHFNSKALKMDMWYRYSTVIYKGDVSTSAILMVEFPFRVFEDGKQDINSVSRTEYLRVFITF